MIRELLGSGATGWWVPEAWVSPFRPLSSIQGLTSIPNITDRPAGGLPLWRS